ARRQRARRPGDAGPGRGGPGRVPGDPVAAPEGERRAARAGGGRGGDRAGDHAVLPAGCAGAAGRRGGAGGDAAMTALWWGIVAVCLGCYALKLAGLAAPQRVLDHPVVRRFAELVPVALLAALIGVQVFTQDGALTFDPARTAGLGAAI